MHIPVIEMSGYEADDIIGTLSKQAEKQGYITYMVTPDKDFAQLVSENIFVYRPARMGNGIEIWGIPEVQEKFEVSHPEQVIDYLGMMGDAVDNIPGFPGVGEKTAKKLIAEFGNMENLLANTDKLKGKMKENIENNAEQGLLSKKLARIILDVPVKFHEEDFELNTPDFEKVKAIFHDLEFRQLTENLVKTFRLEGVQIEVGKKNTPEINKQVSDNAQFDLFSTPSTQSTNTTNQSGYQTIESKSHFYQYVSSPIARKLLIKKLCSQKSVCFDTETTHIKSLEASLVGIAFSWESKKGYYVPFTQNKDEAQKMLEEFRPFFESESIEKIGQNLKYDIKVLSNYGMQVKGPLFDTMIAHYLINPDMRHNMDILAETYLNYSPISIESLIGKKGKNQLSMQQVPLEKQTEYAVEDADITLQLKQYFKPILEETGTQKLFNEIEIPLVSVLADMENEGIRLDVNFLKSMSIDMAKEIALFEEKIFTEAGETFNLASPKQLGDILFDKLKIGGPKPKKTKTGQYATGEEVLGYLAKDHEIIQNILEWRQLVKLQSTYVEALPSQVDKNTLRVHTDYMQTVAATGRLSSNNPNLQNIPIRTERGRQIRKAFIARNEDYILLAADYSQIELRIIAALSGEENHDKSFSK